MEKKNRSEWWFLCNINFGMMGILFVISLIVLLIGNFVDVTLSPMIAGIILGVIVALANFLSTFLSFREGYMNNKSYILFNVYNVILYLILAWTIIPLILMFIGAEMNSILLTVISGLVLSLINFLFTFNMNDKVEE